MTKGVFLAAILGAVLALAGNYALMPRATSSAAVVSESAFDRVMRTGTIRCGYFSWPPYVMRDPNTGKLTGANVDYLEGIASELGWKVDWALEVSPGDAITALNTDKVDMMCGTLWPDGARVKNLTLTIPSFYTAIFAFVRDDDMRFDGNLAAFNDASVTLAAMDGDVTYSVATHDFPAAKVYSIPQSGDGASLMTAVTTGKADALFVGRAEVEAFNASNTTKLREVQGVPPAYVFAESYALRQGEFQFKNTLDAIMLRYNNNGFAQRILKKYNMDGGYYPAITDFQITPTAAQGSK